MLRYLLPLFFLAGSAWAQMQTVSCPDLAAAVQVGACPAEEELQHTFTGYCSDNAKAYAKETDECVDYRLYRKLKNIALWESADGDFSGYVSCDLPVNQLKAAKAGGIKLAKQGSITRVICNYGDNLNFTYRTKAECKVSGENRAECTTRK